MTNRRLSALQAKITDAELDGLLISSPANRRYLSGFTGSAGLLLITPDRAALMSDFRYRDQAAQESPDYAFEMLPQGKGYDALLSDVAARWSLRRLGFEAAALTVAEHGRMQAALAQAGVELQPTEGIVEELRTVKDQDELDLLRRAIAITDEAFAALLPLLRPEMTEQQVAWELEKAMRERGAEGLAFDIIVGSGPNGARPHARAGSSQLGVGRPIVMDFGARYRGYHADMTRTIILGEADERFQEVYGIVLEAQRRAQENMRAGMSGGEADALARDLISERGYGENFGHSLGHGVGLVIHEAPFMRSGSTVTVPAGAVVSVEPGIYIEGWGGVRIEDLVLVTDNGIEILTQSPKDPVVVVR